MHRVWERLEWYEPITVGLKRTLREDAHRGTACDEDVF